MKMERDKVKKGIINFAEEARKSPKWSVLICQLIVSELIDRRDYGFTTRTEIRSNVDGKIKAITEAIHKEGDSHLMLTLSVLIDSLLMQYVSGTSAVEVRYKDEAEE